MKVLTTIIAGAIAGAAIVATALIVGSLAGAVFGGVSTVICNYFFPYIGAKAMALTGTTSAWQAGAMLGFFSGFIKASLTTTKKD